MNYISYNNQTIPLPTPLVTLSQSNISYNKDWAKNTTINLEGQLTGDYENIRKSQSGLLNIFNKNFGNFEIYEATGITGFNFNVISNRPIDTFPPFSVTPGYYTGISGAYMPKNSELILRIDGNYGGYPMLWQRSKDKINWERFTLYKTNYYANQPIFGYIPFNSTYLYPQSSPYINYPMSGTPSHSDLGDQNNPNINSRGIYSGNIGDYNYFRLSLTGGGGGDTTQPQANLIINGFDAEKIYEKSGIIIRSINFEESPYFGILNYSIGLDSFESDYKVIEPKNEFSFAEGQDKTLRLSHNISAKGLNTSAFKSNALDNAINFVKNYTGLNNVPSVKFISGFNNKFYLQSFSESIDRLNSTYSIQEEYISNLFYTGGSGNLNYTLNITSGADSNIIQVDINGNYKGPLNGDISLLRDSLNIYDVVTNIYTGYINPIPIEFNISENTGENSISFDYSFDNLPLSNPYYKYEGSVSRNEIDQLITVQARAEMIARGSLKYRSSLVESNASTIEAGLVNFATGLYYFYKDFHGLKTKSTLKRRTSLSTNKNKNQGSLTTEASYDDRDLPITGGEGMINASFDINVQAPYWYMNNQPVCNIYGYHIINDFDIATLPKLNVNIEATMASNAQITEKAIATGILKILSGITPKDYNYSVIITENQNVTKKTDDFISDVNYSATIVDKDNAEGLMPKIKTADNTI